MRAAAWWEVIFLLLSERSACSDTKGAESSRTSVCFPGGEEGRVGLSHMGIPVLSRGHMFSEGIRQRTQHKHAAAVPKRIKDGVKEKQEALSISIYQHQQKVQNVN